MAINVGLIKSGFLNISWHAYLQVTIVLLAVRGCSSWGWL